MNTKEVKNLIKSLEAAKEKAAKRDFEVTITETRQKTVTVMAKDKREAEDAVYASYTGNEHDLYAEHITGVEFEAKRPEREVSLSGKGKEDAVL